MASLVQKFKAFTNNTPYDTSLIYDHLHINRILVKFHPNFTVYCDSEDNLTLDVEQKEVITFIIFKEHHMEVYVSRDFGRDFVNYDGFFELKYDATPEWIFQLSTIHDLGFIEYRYMKYLNKLQELYSIEYD